VQSANTSLAMAETKQKPISLMQWIRTSYFWVAGVSVTFICYIYCYIPLALSYFAENYKDGKGVHRLASLWGQIIIKMMPGWKIEVTGRENLPADNEPVVIVANHESMSDIWAMYYLNIQFRWLSKDSVFKIPMIGHAMKWAGYIPITRGNKSSHIESMRQSSDRLRRGIPMFFFPEGTRSTDGTIKEFKIGAFKLARDSKVAILPIAIHGAGDLMRKGSSHPSMRATVRLKILPKIAPPDLNNEDLELYAEQVRQAIITAHNTINGPT
jgi:1-acyl-sn-glycerol-3-phosphate acyltransferase